MKKINGISRSRADKAFDILDYILLTVAFLLVAYPLYFVVIASVSDPTAVYEGRVLLYPIKPTLEGYARIFSYDSLFVGYKNTLIYAVIGTAINVVLTVTAGYALSRSSKVDVVVRYYIENRTYNVQFINIALDHYGLPLLGVS